MSIVKGTATPLMVHFEDMLTDKGYTQKTVTKARLAMQRLTDWMRDNDISPPVIESVDRKVAYRVYREVYAGMNPSTGNSLLGWYGRYWKWLVEAGHLPETTNNPWNGLKIKDDRPKRLAQGETKRPFTDEEVSRLLKAVGSDDDPLPLVMRIAALSGMRPGEIAELKVGDVDLENWLYQVRDGKTVNAIRRVPIHGSLKEAIAALAMGRRPAGDYLIADMPGRPSKDRSRFDSLGKRFTRRKRELSIGRKLDGLRADDVDFYSFRRWFMRKAGAALDNGAQGYLPWTIADVVGHSKEGGDMPLGLTMGRYPGAASLDALRACVEAVQLPELCG